MAATTALMNARAEFPFDTCLSQTLAASKGWMARWVQQVASGKQSSLRERLTERWFVALAEAVRADQIRDADGPKATGPVKSHSLEQLELMDDLQVQTSVVLSRMLQVVQTTADEQLKPLTALLCGAQGLSHVRSEANPLRPEVVIGALMQALSEAHIDEVVRQRWLHSGALPLGQALSDCYARMALDLRERGVEPAEYLVLQVRAGQSSDSLADGLGEALVAEPLDDESPLVLTLDHLHQLLVGNLAHSGSAVTNQGASGSGNAMVRLLAAEVVSQMLRNIAQDERLLAPVRELVLRLKPALLHLASRNPRFFADRDNPARRLLDCITARSLAFATEQDKGYPAFAAQLQDTVRSLQASSPALPERIRSCLGQMELLESADHRPAKAALVKVEQRHLLAERVAAEFKRLEGFDKVPLVVRHFLLGPWAQAVSHARLHADVLGEAPMLAEVSWPRDAAAQRFMDILPDLLWSCQLVRAGVDRPRLVRVASAMLRTLREGLDAIDFPREQAQTFFQTLLGLHEAAYKTQRSAVYLTSSLRRLPDLVPEPWFQGEEAAQSGFVDTLTMGPDFVGTEPMLLESQAQEPLQVGAWVELLLAARMQRCQLRWASPHRTLFLFSTAEGHPVSLTRRGMHRMKSSGKLRIVAPQGVVDEALTAVARLAWINSGKLR